MTYKPTFTKTPRKRAWHKRLTPAAWLVIGVLALAFVVGAMSVTEALAGGGKPVPFGGDLPKAESTAAPKPTVAAPKPTEPAGDWWGEALPETPLTATQAVTGVWWVEQMTCDDQGNCTPPQAVIDEIVADYWAWQQAIPYYYYELVMTPEQLAGYYSGRMLETQVQFVSLVAETGAMWDGEKVVREYNYATRVPHVSACSSDGLACLLGETVQGDLKVYRYDLSARQIIETITDPTDRQYQGVNIWRVTYDMEDGKWKLDEYLRWVPAPGQ